MPIGEIAALATAVCWASAALVFQAAGQRMGSLVLNLVRLVLALVPLSLLGWVWRGQLLPLDATPAAWGWLSLSGIVGFVLGDLCLFRAYVVLGPRLSTLMMTLAPPITALGAYAVLGERLALQGWIGMALTLGGVAWTVRAPSSGSGTHPPWSHLLLGVGGALGQAGGLVLSKLGMGSYNAFAATQIRVLAGIAGFVLLFTVIGWWPKVLAGVRDARALRLAAGGACLGPFLGVGLSLVAIQHTDAGVAASLMATTPILILPAVALIHHERIRARAILGAALAVAGVVVLVAG